MLGKLSTRYLNDAPSLEHLKNRCSLWKNHRTEKNICVHLPIWSKETSHSKPFCKSTLFLCKMLQFWRKAPMKIKCYENAIFVKESLSLTLLKSRLFREIVSLAGLSQSKYLPLLPQSANTALGLTVT